MHQNYVITPRQSCLLSYRRALKEELRQTCVEEDLKKCPINHPQIIKYKARILGGRSPVSDFADWTEFLLKEYGPKKRCLSLGSGIGRVEKYLIEIGFTASFETIEINPRSNVIARNVNRRIDTKEGDLNFVELKPNNYDFILCHGVLHHLVNLEHVLEQINLALKPDGLLLIYEYVGESRWQFSEKRISKLREIFPKIRLNNIPIWNIGGFEAIRSSDLLELIIAQFGKACDRSVNYGCVFFPLVICNWPAAQHQIERIVELDTAISQRGELSPCYHMGVYHKANATPSIAIPWTDEVINDKLSLKIPFPYSFVRIGRKIKNNLRLRTRLRSLLSHLK